MAQQNRQSQKDAQGASRSRPATGQEGSIPPAAAREPAEGSRQTVRENIANDPGSNTPASDNDRGNHPSGGISNRGMDPSTEQQDLPDRGATRDSDQ